MQAPVQQIMPAQQPLQAPAVPPVGGNIIAAAGGISQALAAQGFEGLDMGFGSFPIVKLQDTTFSTSDGDTLGNTFCCVMHASRKKFLLKCEDSNDAEEFVYSYDKVHTTGNKLVEDVKKAWGEKGWVNPVWKEYADVTAQLVDLNNRELGGVVMLSIPYTSNSRLSGYITTLMVKGRQVNQVITQVYHGQKVTSGKFAFYPWAFKEYMLVSQMIGV